MSRIEELEKRLAADPNSRMFVQLAEEYRKAGLLEQAIEVCEEGIQKHPQYPSARVALGRALLEAEAFDRASEQFETVLKTVPDNILANKFLGETYHRLGRLDEALKKYQVAQTLAPEDPELGDRIAAVQSELAAGPAAASASPPAPPAPAGSKAEPPPPAAPSAAPPSGAAPLGVPEPPTANATAPLPAPPAAGAESVDAAAEEPPRPAIEDDLPPIPLVDVDEPMVLEDRFAAPTPTPAPPETAAPPDADMDMDMERSTDAEASFVEPEPFLDTESYVESSFEPEPELTPFAPPPPPPPPAADAPAPPAPTPTQADLETKTMAELYASQGHLDQAIDVYEKLVARRPDEATYRTRLDELKMLEQATRQAKKASAPTAPQAPPPAAPPAPQEGGDKTIEVLSGWLDAIKKSKES